MEVLCLASSHTTEIIQTVCKNVGIQLHSCSTTKEACQHIIEGTKRWIAVVTALGHNQDTNCRTLLEAVKQHATQSYVIIYSYTAQCGSDPTIRIECFKAGAKMVTCFPSALKLVLKQILVEKTTIGGTLTCPYCKIENLTENTLHRHLELYHTYDANEALPCPLCRICIPSNRGGVTVHYHNNHGPRERREAQNGPPGSLTAFALVVCQRLSDGKFLMVQEPLGIGGGYWLPAGRVDPGERLIAGGKREALEEAGIHIKITRVLKFDLSNALRIIYLANPVAGTDDTPKTVPDFESAGAMWISAEDVHANLPQAYCRSGRATEPLKWFPRVANGERGMSIDNSEYNEFENVVLELGQKHCTMTDVKDKLLPAWRNLHHAFSIDTKKEDMSNKPNQNAEQLYKSLILD